MDAVSVKMKLCPWRPLRCCLKSSDHALGWLPKGSWASPGVRLVFMALYGPQMVSWSFGVRLYTLAVLTRFSVWLNPRHL